MDPLHFDSYNSDSSTPHTPSPRSSLSLDDIHSFNDSVVHLKQVHFDSPDSAHMFPADDGVVDPVWQNNSYHSRGSLLQELYAPEHAAHPDLYPSEANFVSHDWSQGMIGPDHPRFNLHDEPALIRRASYPYAIRERDDRMHMASSFMGPDAGPIYGEPLPLHGSPHLPLAAEPAALHAHCLDEPFASMSSSPHSSYQDFDQMEDGIKLEDAAPIIVPSHNGFYRPGSSGSCHSVSYMSPLQVQHTDDASSKETQFLRRRCYNCHTTEPPSWRRSTLNPGKIVCNKCGLYERTHLRPRPPRFDELRAGKTRKQQPVKAPGSVSPKSKLGSLVKKEPRDFDFDTAVSRRGSVSSSSSHSGSGQSDWDDSVSCYSSSGSAPPSVYNSPMASSFSVPRLSPSQSPPLPPSRDGGIRLPNTPLSDIASLQSQSNQSTPRKAATAPFFNTLGDRISSSPQPDFYPRRGSLPVDMPSSAGQRRHTTIGMPEVTGWQAVPMSDLTPSARNTSGPPAAACQAITA